MVIGLRHRGLGDADRFEAPLQGRVLLDVPAVLTVRRRADQPQVTAGQRRLEHACRRPSRAPSAAPAPTTACSSSTNSTIDTLGRDHLVDHRGQPLLEVAAVLGAGDHARPGRARPPARPAASRAPRRRPPAGRCPPRSPSCRRRGRRPAPGCSSCAGPAPRAPAPTSASRPITGSSRPCAAASVRSRPKRSSRGVRARVPVGGAPGAVPGAAPPSVLSRLPISRSNRSSNGPKPGRSSGTCTSNGVCSPPMVLARSPIRPHERHSRPIGLDESAVRCG